MQLLYSSDFCSAIRPNTSISKYLPPPLYFFHRLQNPPFPPPDHKKTGRNMICSSIPPVRIVLIMRKAQTQQVGSDRVVMGQPCYRSQEQGSLIHIFFPICVIHSSCFSNFGPDTIGLLSAADLPYQPFVFTSGSLTRR